MDVLFHCGHARKVDPDKDASPVCHDCGERRIGRVIGARAPRFTGVASGPHCDTRKLDAVAVNLAEKPLTLKPDTMTKDHHAADTRI